MEQKVKDHIDRIISRHWVPSDFRNYSEKINLICGFFDEYERRLYEGTKALESKQKSKVELALILMGSSNNYKDPHE
jgi:hypothetical protein